MEEHRNKVVNLHATQSKIISKFTSDISQNTSKSTSIFTNITSKFADNLGLDCM